MERQPERGDLLIYRANLLTIFKVDTPKNVGQAGVLRGFRQTDSGKKPLYLKVAFGLSDALWVPRADVLSTVIAEMVLLVAGDRSLMPFASASEKRIRYIVDSNPSEQGFWLLPGMMMCHHPGRMAIPIGKASDIREQLKDVRLGGPATPREVNNG